MRWVELAKDKSSGFCQKPGDLAAPDRVPELCTDAHAGLAFPNPYTRLNTSELIKELFTDCGPLAQKSRMQ